MKKIVLIVSVLAVAGLFVFRVVQARNNARPAAVEEKVFTVETATIATRDVPRLIILTGNVKPELEVDVAPKVGGRIESIRADLGDAVKKGAALAVIEHRETELQVQQAEAGADAARVAYENARDEYARGEKLQEAGAVSDSQLDAMRLRRDAAHAQFKQADAALALARESLANSTIRSPIDGVVTKKTISLGQLVGPGQPAFQVQKSDTVKFTAGVDAAQFRFVKKGMPVAVSVDGYPDEKFTGRIARIAPTLDPVTRRATVEVEIDNPDHRLLPHMFANGAVEIGRLENAIAVPAPAVLRNGEERTIFVADGNVARKRSVQIAFADERVAVIAKGAATGEALIVAGQHRLSDGDRINVRQAAAADAESTAVGQ